MFSVKENIPGAPSHFVDSVTFISLNKNGCYNVVDEDKAEGFIAYFGGQDYYAPDEHIFVLPEKTMKGNEVEGVYERKEGFAPDIVDRVMMDLLNEVYEQDMREIFGE